MSGRRLISILAFCGACASGEAPDRGRLILERTSPDPRRLAELGASASYCARDTTLSVVGSGPEWSAAIAVRAPWPSDSNRSFAVDSVPRDLGRAGVAARAQRDTAGSALIGRSGTVNVSAGRTLAGTFEVAVMNDSTPFALGGRFDRLTVTEACP